MPIPKRRGTKKDRSRKAKKYWEKKKSQYTGGSAYDSWEELSEAVKRRDNYTCVACSARGYKAGGKAILHATHIRPLSKGGKNTLSNLLTKCVSCHMKEDGHDHMKYNPVFKKQVVNDND